MSHELNTPANFPSMFCTTAWWILCFCNTSAAPSRVMSGVAYSLLFSSFESWLVAQHELLGLPSDDLGSSLSRMYFLNGLSGILMGLVAEAGADAAPLTEVGGDESIFYVNAIESAVSAMEVSVIGAKNVALLCCRDLGC